MKNTLKQIAEGRDSIEVVRNLAREALAQPEQEPVAHVRVVEGMLGPVRRGKGMASLPDGDYSVYTTPPQRTWIGLTDDEKMDVCERLNAYNDDLIDAIEAKLKQKNGYAEEKNT